MQQRAGRRGAVFSVRVTDDERRKLERLQRHDKGPRALGPWLIWRALNERRRRGTTAAGDEPAKPGAARAGTTRPAGKPTILDLCAGSGEWSEPYRRSGKYNVIRVSLPKLDVRTFVPPPHVHGVLAAPPCEQFSLARNGHRNLPRDYVRGMEIVNACMRIIGQCEPEWWALENPAGHLSKWLGTPRDVFEPCDFGDPWTKRTALWGSFTLPIRGPFVKPLGGGPPCKICPRRPGKRPKTLWCNSGKHRAAHRAITPAGFAKAFFLVNP